MTSAAPLSLLSFSPLSSATFWLPTISLRNLGYILLQVLRHLLQESIRPLRLQFFLHCGDSCHSLSYTVCTTQNEALWMASDYGHHRCVRILLKNGADVKASDGDGNNCLMRAIERNHRYTMLQLIVLVNTIDLEIFVFFISCTK